MDSKNIEALKLHEEHKGKLSIESVVPLKNKYDLSLAYTPGVAAPCIEITNNPESVYQYTMKSRLVAIITDGSAVLGLGNIGPLAAIPVMEGKAALLKTFANVDGFPICLDTQDPDEIVDTIIKIAPVFGAIMLEDIAAPKCVDIERRLQAKLTIPVCHDDQHGTAMVVAAAIINASRLLNKPLTSMRIVVSGTGAAGSAICRLLKAIGVKTIHAYNKQGIMSIKKYNDYDVVLKGLLNENIIDSYDDYQVDDLASLIKGADGFIGVSAGGILTETMVKSMNSDPIVLAMANPIPEIMPDLAIKAKAAIVGTGRSDFPNQINNVLVFPGLFKGALQARLKSIDLQTKIRVAYALAHLILEEDLRSDYILPDIFDKRVVPTIVEAVVKPK
jgi:malate dehydrogenase (oxaloacetate-decarboxylating)